MLGGFWRLKYGKSEKEKQRETMIEKLKTHSVKSLEDGFHALLLCFEELA